MSELNALEELRTAARNMAKGRNLENHEECNLFLIIADEIEAEIAERYMELPCDADGVPIRVGDELKGGFTVDYVSPHWVFAVGRGAKHDGSCRHVKPRTLEDVLNDRINDVLSVMTSGIGIALETALNDSFGEECADEIREMMGGNAECIS